MTCGKYFEVKKTPRSQSLAQMAKLNRINKIVSLITLVIAFSFLNVNMRSFVSSFLSGTPVTCQDEGIVDEVGKNHDSHDSVTTISIEQKAPSYNDLHGYIEEMGADENVTLAAPKFFLYRLIGNNMPPLQCYGQLFINTMYTLDHESELPGCRKLWVLNNIVNATERGLLLDLLLSRGYTMEDIIVRRVDYSKIAKYPRDSWTSVVTAQNEARNFIIRHGIAAGARWILAFDGNQFYTKQAWRSIVAAANLWERRGLKYFKVPMYRLYSLQNPAWLHENTTFPTVRRYAPVLWESQLAFRNDSDERYLEGIKYGRDNKLEMIDRVCGTGRFGEKNRPKSEGPADTGRCGCHKEVGNDRRQREVVDRVALRCGYSVRLWYHPCNGVNASQIFVDKVYRANLRNEGHSELEKQVVQEVEKIKLQ